MEKLVLKCCTGHNQDRALLPCGGKRNAVQVCSKKKKRNEINKGSAPFPLLFQLTFCLSLSSCFFFLSFVSSKTEDWGYLNEDGELGLAYQGLKQVARSNTFFFSSLLLLLSPPVSLPSCFFVLLCCCHVVLDGAHCPLWEQLEVGFPNCRN